MSVQLEPYSPTHAEITARRIVDFDGHHRALVGVPGAPDETALADALRSIDAWTAPGHALYIINSEGRAAGFLHLGFRGDIVAWIEDIYVDPGLRGRGVATAAIGLAEGLAGQMGYQAVSIDVVPRNADAMRLYHRLGYTGLSLLTLRKDLGPSRRDRNIRLLGLDFKY